MGRPREIHWTHLEASVEEVGEFVASVGGCGICLQSSSARRLRSKSSERLVFNIFDVTFILARAKAAQEKNERNQNKIGQQKEQRNPKPGGKEARAQKVKHRENH